MYLFTCRESVAEDFKKRIWPKNYLYEQEHIYAFAVCLFFLKRNRNSELQDLVALHNGHLESNLTGLLKYATSHVMSCALCRQKGFYCELCRKKELLYPFQDNIHRVCFFSFSPLSCCHPIFLVQKIRIHIFSMPFTAKDQEWTKFRFWFRKISFWGVLGPTSFRFHFESSKFSISCPPCYKDSENFRFREYLIFKFQELFWW